MSSLDTDPDTVLIWTDVETTGLDAATGHLLEIAVIPTTVDLVQLGDPYTAVIRHDNANDLMLAANATVQQMHTASGLWRRLAKGTPVDQVDTDLQAYIRGFAPTRRQGMIAGNSVRLDMNFLDRFLPGTADHLHYRSIDVTGITQLANWWLRFVSPQKALNHSALADIGESIAQLRAFRDFLQELTGRCLPLNDLSSISPSTITSK